MFEALLNGLYGGLPQGEDLLHSRTGEHLDMPAIDNVSMLRKETWTSGPVHTDRQPGSHSRN